MVSSNFEIKSYNKLSGQFVHIFIMNNNEPIYSVLTGKCGEPCGGYNNSLASCEFFCGETWQFEGFGFTSEQDCIQQRCCNCSEP